MTDDILARDPSMPKVIYQAIVDARAAMEVPTLIGDRIFYRGVVYHKDDPRCAGLDPVVARPLGLSA
jgi:hypothetical protein